MKNEAPLARWLAGDLAYGWVSQYGSGMTGSSIK